MNIKKILTLVIFMTTLITSAQIQLTGVVKDSIGPLEMANVIALDTVAKKNCFLWLYRCQWTIQIRSPKKYSL